MSLARLTLAAGLSLALAGPALAEDSGDFIYRLGADTTSVEHYTRTKDRIVVDQVGRAPRVLHRRFTYEFSPSGACTRFSVVITAPGAPAGSPPLQRAEGTLARDSVFLEVRRETTLVQSTRAPLRADAMVMTGTSPWAVYETYGMRLLKQKADTLGMPMYYIGAVGSGWVTLHKLGRDSIMVTDNNGSEFRAKVDGDGRVQGVLPVSGTGAYAVTRVKGLDVGAMSAVFSAREKQAGAMGPLSTRDTLRADAGGTSLWIDYGRPAKRGRVVFGGVVRWGEVWRTGANAATQFKTDQALRFGETTVPAGFYTLWTIPSPTGWKLVFNSQTGQWGTEHDPAKDVATVDMAVGTLPAEVERFTISVEATAQGGALHLDWDTTRASAPFTVVPAEPR
jgi:hypothetical protein